MITMKHKWLTTLFLLITLCAYGQNKNSTIADKLCGVWIEESFLNVFDSTRNICDARQAFHLKYYYSYSPNFDVHGLKIFQKSTKDSTIYGYFRLTYYMMSAISYDDSGNIAYSFDFDKNANNSKNIIRLNINQNIYWEGYKATDHVLKIINDSTINIHRYVVKPSKTKEVSYNYRRISKHADTLVLDVIDAFCMSYFTGDYVLKDSNKTVLSENFSMDASGNLVGYPPFDNLRYSLDVDKPYYCFENYAYLYIIGSNFEHIMEFLWEYDKKENSYYLYDAEYFESTPKKGKLIYVLVKK
jgi:hypothetical protein